MLHQWYYNSHLQNITPRPPPLRSASGRIDNIIRLNYINTYHYYRNGVDETKLSFGFIHTCELNYRTFALHIALFRHAFFKSAPQGGWGVLREKQREKIPFSTL